jgi:hypothetical protein
VGGIGSGKTTELILADNWFQKNELISLYVDLTSETDLSDLKSGSLLASFGLHLVRFIDEYEQSHLSKEEQASLAELKKAIVEYAHGKKTRIWVDEDDYQGEYEPDDYDGPPGHYVTSETPGKLTPPLPKIKSDVRDMTQPLKKLIKFAGRVSGNEEHVVLICDGLDRLSTSDRFWAVAHHDCRILRELGVSLLVSGPLPILYREGVSENFDRVQHLAALRTDEDGQENLRSVIFKRGGQLLLKPEQIERLCNWSGGVLRDLITLARDAAEEAYLNGKEAIDDAEIAAAARQLGTAYLRGLSPKQQSRLRRFEKIRSFDTSDPSDMKLLATRRILEYSASDFRVHPALLDVLRSAEDKDA